MTAAGRSRPRGAAGCVAPVLLRSVAAALRASGIAVEPVFQGLAFAAADLDEPGFRVSHQEALAALRRALPLFGRCELGLELGQKADIFNRGAIALGMMTSATLGDAIALANRFPASAGFLLPVRIEQDPERQTKLVDPQVGAHDLAPFLVDQLFASAVSIRRQLAGPDYSPLRVELARAPPASAKAHLEFFGCPVEFGGVRNALVTATSWLGRELPTANAMCCRLAVQLLEREAGTAEAETSEFAATVGRAFRRSLADPPKPAELAASLHLSERTFRRRLADEGLSYVSLLEECRQARALELLPNARLTLAEIAHEVGFSDTRVLRRALKRWTGQTLSALRGFDEREAAEDGGPASAFRKPAPPGPRSRR